MSNAKDFIFVGGNTATIENTIVASGNITGNYILGNGSQLSNVVTSITAGNNISITGSTGSITISSTASGGGGNTGPTFGVQTTVNTADFGTTSPIQTLNVKNWDSGNCFNNTAANVVHNGVTVPAYSFGPNVAGYYQLTYNYNGSVNAPIGPVNATTYVYLNGYSNGVATLIKGPTASPYNPSAGSGATFTDQNMCGSFTVYLNGTTDYVYLNGYASVSTTNIGTTWFSGFYVHP